MFYLPCANPLRGASFLVKEGEAKLDVLGGGGGHPQELVGAPTGGVRGVAALVAGEVSLRHLALL